MISTNSASMRTASVYRSFFGMCERYKCHCVYAPTSLWSTSNVAGGGRWLDSFFFIMKVQLGHNFSEIVSVDNLLLAWEEFVRGKRGRRDVQEFQLYLMDNIFALRDELSAGMYKHGPYETFRIADPKVRIIHKAPVRDRLLHHAVYRVLYPFFDRTFIPDSYSCRKGKGTHKALNQFRKYFWRVSKNNTRTCWVLKCDIKQFFASVDHVVLLTILREYICDKKILALCREIVKSFNSGTPGVGLPLGNLTSQLFVNIYMNVFDQYTKHALKAKHYIRYADDFVLLSHDRTWLEAHIPPIETFLRDRLKLTVHKVSVRTVASGVDFLGWVHFTDHRVIRTTTKKRMFRRVKEHPTEETVQSYLGLLKHGNGWKLQKGLLEASQSGII